jgi:hypothetical protein
MIKSGRYCQTVDYYQGARWLMSIILATQDDLGSKPALGKQFM